MIKLEVTEAELVEESSQPDNQQFFARQNDLAVIKEYNSEDNLPRGIKKDFWGLITKSIKLGFWTKEDELDLFFHKNLINTSYMMQKTKKELTFEDMHKMNMVGLLMYADFKRGVGMEKVKINERTLQATSITQHVNANASPVRKSAGVLGTIKNFFG